MLRRAETSRRITLHTAASRQGGSCLRYATTASQGVATLVDAPCLKASLPLLSSCLSYARREKRVKRETEKEETDAERQRERETVEPRARVRAIVEEEDEEDDDDDDEEDEGGTTETTKGG